ncbi:MAG TPA: xanthine dehydrogenase family protein molybdopterin-binding subunit, partial [Thermomicrobiales bacterium]|nr:xanthine dehydrogenase family protein molybdopterin-binding subunit [Thermomicrobiales bacterium]
MLEQEAKTTVGWIGRDRKRSEDPRLITGQGCYIEDLRIPDLVDVALVRSIHPHARIRAIEASAARAMPGVLGVFTAADLDGVGGVPVAGNLNIPEHPPLASDRVRFVGDPLVAVVAEDRMRAEDALAAVAIDYEPLPAVVDARAALEPDAPLVHDEFGTNVSLTAAFSTGDG